jgi:hypothetical protein
LTDIKHPENERNAANVVIASEAKQSSFLGEKEAGLLRRIRLRPKAGFGRQECSWQ